MLNRQEHRKEITDEPYITVTYEGSMTAAVLLLVEAVETARLAQQPEVDAVDKPLYNAAADHLSGWMARLGGTKISTVHVYSLLL